MLSAVLGGAVDEEVPSKNMVRVEVEDCGIGILDEVKTSLFSPFKQAQRLTGGTGLGEFININCS